MKETFSTWRARVEKTDEFHATQAILRATEQIHLALERAGLSRTELAQRLDVSPAYVTKILRGNVNFTLSSLARIARALGAEVLVSFEPARRNRRR